MKFDRPPVHMPDTPGPWGVDSKYNSWYVVHSVTLRAKRIGFCNSRRTNFFDRAMEEAARRNKEETRGQENPRA